MLDNKWNERFLALAEHVSQWSKDPSTKVGSVIVNDSRIVIIAMPMCKLTYNCSWLYAGGALEQ